MAPLIERLLALVAAVGLGSACCLGIATAWPLLTDRTFRRAFVRYWGKESDEA